MAVHKCGDGRFVISAYKCWRPGVYEDERSARFALRLPDAALQELQDQANLRGDNITWGDLAKKSEELRATHPKD